MKHKGFTLVEVALFLALTGILFVGIIAGTSNSIAEQRFFDSTQNFAEFLRSVYSQVSNPEGVGTGRSEQYAIYGKMISFGQEYDLTGEPVPADEQRIFVYDVIGGVQGIGTGSAADLLYEIGANVAVVTAYGAGNTVTDMTVAGIAESYEPKWGAAIETTATNWPNNMYEGTILIVRHPMSGTINTLVSPKVIEVNKLVIAERRFDEAQVMLTDVLNVLNDTDETNDWQAFRVEEVDFCVDPGGKDYAAPLRWNIRLVENARNASGVETIDRDDFRVGDGDESWNKCQERED